MMKTVFECRWVERIEDVPDWREICAKNSVDADCEALRTGNARYCTRKEEAIFWCLVSGIFAVLLSLIMLCWHFAPAIDKWGAL